MTLGSKEEITKIQEAKEEAFQHAAVCFVKDTYVHQYVSSSLPLLTGGCILLCNAYLDYSITFL
jgi:hypothetical protein